MCWRWVKFFMITPSVGFGLSLLQTYSLPPRNGAFSNPGRLPWAEFFQAFSLFVWFSIMCLLHQILPFPGISQATDLIDHSLGHSPQVKTMNVQWIRLKAWKSMIWACPIIDVIGRGVAFNNHMGESRAIADLQPASRNGAFCKSRAFALGWVLSGFQPGYFGTTSVVVEMRT